MGSSRKGCHQRLTLVRSMAPLVCRVFHKAEGLSMKYPPDKSLHNELDLTCLAVVTVTMPNSWKHLNLMFPPIWDTKWPICNCIYIYT